jgi:hypothetical protein
MKTIFCLFYLPVTVEAEERLEAAPGGRVGPVTVPEVPLSHGVGGVAPARQRLRQHRVLEAHLYIYIVTYLREYRLHFTNVKKTAGGRSKSQDGFIKFCFREADFGLSKLKNFRSQFCTKRSANFTIEIFAQLAPLHKAKQCVKHSGNACSSLKKPGFTPRKNNYA